jgi:hypothetical protein
MKPLFRTLAIAALLVGSTSSARAQVSFGITIGPPPAPRAYRVPPPPGADYDWVEGYWYPDGSRYKWHDGYWTRAPYQGAYWVAPYYDGRQYYAGRWEGARGNVVHDHRWDRGRQRDERRAPQERRDDRRDDQRRNQRGDGR